MPTKQTRSLRRLARACGVQTAYLDTDSRRRVACPEALVAVLRALGQEIDHPDDAAEALRRHQETTPPAPATVVAWNGRLSVDLRPPHASSSRAPRLELRREDGELQALTVARDELRDDGRRRLVAGERIPSGVHELIVETSPRRVHHTVVFSAPTRCYRRDAASRDLGVFVPLYALRSNRSWGTGDLTDLTELARQAERHGCRWVGTLPMLACFLDEPFEPSPYAPITRLFWNELFADPESAPELELCPTARTLLDAAELRSSLDAVRTASLVDYRRAMSLKRPALDRLAAAVFANDDARARLERFVAQQPQLEDYARFRATVEQRRCAWTDWPTRQRDGDLRPGDWDENARRTHLYVQWLLYRQLEGITAGSDGRGLYLDLPVGVNGAGFDVWRHRSQFVTTVDAGAPPDTFFRGGQNWGFPPPLPCGEGAHTCFRAAIRRHLQHADLLRIDHVMGLHRLFWIPRGFDATDGVYVRYPAAELYAVLSMESHRTRSTVVGENLGTVPVEVDRTLRRRGLLGMHVTQFAMEPEEATAVESAPSGTLASLNTHDMPPFAAFWDDCDQELREQLGLLAPDQRAIETTKRAATRRAVVAFLRTRGRLAGRAPATVEVLHALLAELADGPAEIVLISLEDLWGETRPQNMPGITDAYPSWRHKCARSLEAIFDEGRSDLLRHLADLRQASRRLPT